MAGSAPIPWFNLLLSALLVPLVIAIIQEIRLVRRLQSQGQQVVGRVLHQREARGRNGAYFVPTIGFTTWLGQAIAAESVAYSGGLELFDGEEVLVFYDAAQPTCFLLEQQLTNTSRYWWLVGIGFLMLLFWLKPSR